MHRRSGFSCLYGVFIVTALLFCSTSAWASGFAELNLGFNLFDFYATADVKGSVSAHGNPIEKGSGHTGLIINPTPSIGVVAGYNSDKSNWAIGGELAYFSADGSTKSYSIKDVNIDGGDLSIKMLRIGPQFRYYFPIGKVKPFAGFALEYTKTIINIDGEVRYAGFTGSFGGVDMDCSHLNLGFLGGALVQVHKNIAVGGSARIDLYLPLNSASDKESGNFLEGKISYEPTWAPFSIYGNVAFLF